MISLSNADARMLMGILRHVAESPPAPGIKSLEARRKAGIIYKKINKKYVLDKTTHKD